MKKCLALLLLFLCFTCPVLAAETPTEEILEDVLKSAESLQGSNFNFAETAKQAIAGELNFTLEGILDALGKLLLGEVQENAALLVKMLALAVLAGVLCHLHPEGSEQTTGDIGFLVCFAAIAALSVSVISNLEQVATATIDEMLLFIAALMPALSTLTLSVGTLAAGFFPGLFLAMQAFVAVCRNVFLPLIMVITALSVVNALSGQFHISRLIESARKCIKWGLGLLLTVFVGILGIHSFSSGAAVSLAGKTVKYALCNFVPLVGGVLADSAEAVLTSMRVIRGAVGIAGLIGLLSFCVLPLIKVLASSVLYHFAAGVAEPATDKRIVTLLLDLAGNITLIFSILLMVCVMFIISLALLCAFLP